MPMESAVALWGKAEDAARSNCDFNALVRALCLADLFYLLVRVCGRKDMLHPWVYARCREVEAAPDDHLDLWAREHYKSTIISFGLTIQDILKDPNVTFGIFSHTRPIAKAFLRQIMRELESNETLHACFPDILWGKNTKESPKWALDVDTPVLTVNGWKRHGDLTPGDLIYGSDGKVIKVTGNSGPMDGVDCRRVVFDDCEFIASADHLWPVHVKTMSGVHWDKAKLRILKTDELRRKKTMRMLSTPAFQPPERAKSLITVPPYILGLWLGDGTAGTNIISMHREDEATVLAQLEEYWYESYVHRRKPNDSFSMYGVRGLKESLLSLGCLKTKHIPEAYMLGNEHQRRALLQGLMDSDGTCNKDGRCMFSNTNVDLARGVFFLASSLGMRPSILNFLPSPPGRQRVYHVYFVGIKSNPPFRLRRKLAKCKDKRIKDGRYLRAIEKIPSVTVNCIKVDAKDSLYLAGYSMVPTHNSEDDGIIVKRSSNPKEATVEAWGLVDGQPTSKHYSKLLYDDIVVQASVTNPEMIEKSMTALEQSYNLGAIGGSRRFAGTRWHFNDGYATLIKRGTAKLRCHPGKIGGTEDGASVLWPEEVHEQKRRDMGPYTYGCQILLNPKADALQGFKREWLRHYKSCRPETMTKYILVDAASSKKKSSDYTAIMVVGLGQDKNYYVLDMIRDRLALHERADRIFRLHRTWHPLQVRYERYGMMADIEHIKDRQDRETYHFNVVEVAGKSSKADRIKRLLPLFEQGRVYMPVSLHATDYEKTVRDLVHDFIEEEYTAFPVGSHDDMLDCLSRITEPDLPLVWPKAEQTSFADTLTQGRVNHWPKARAAA